MSDPTKQRTNSSDERPLPNPKSSHERRDAAPEAEDLRDAESVWENAETTPFPEEQMPGRPGGGERVADAGDIGGGANQPYQAETQADTVAKQTVRTREVERKTPSDGSKKH